MLHYNTTFIFRDISIKQINITSSNSFAQSEGWIRGAVLDVVEKEPLPATSALWGHPAVTISPHASGFNREEVSLNIMALDP